MIKRLVDNPLLEEHIVKDRFKELQGGYASLAIENLHVTPEEKNL